jgi:aryl-alcohol dehydrogenase-like predicted oxidoreductase
MQYTADLLDWTRFVSMQNQYSLMQREDEREMFGVLADQGAARAALTLREPTGY